MKLLIVIVSYKVTDLTIDCLRSLSEQIDAVPGAHVAVCENGTGDDSADRLRAVINEQRWERWASVTAIHPNRGFCGGNNAVIRPALASDDPPQYVMLLNSDTLVRTDALRSLVEFMDDRPDVGIAGSRLENPDGSPRQSLFRFQSVASEFERGVRLGIVSRLLASSLTRLPIPEAPTQVDWLAGASMIIRRDVFDDIGLLDEGFFTYFDDIDFCLNARRAGWPTWYVPQSRVVHLAGQTTGISAAQQARKRRARYWFQARRRYFLKNHGAIYAALADSAFITGFALWRLRRWFCRHKDTDPSHMLADAIRESVFVQGAQVRDVVNPSVGPNASRERAVSQH